MAANRFLKLLSSSTNPIVFDGAMGTMLHTRGESFEGCLDELNLSNPGLVAEIHRAYIEAGAQVIMTNTFGANHFKLSEHGLENQLHDIICAGANLAQKVVEASFKPVLIAGDVGPLGIRLAPFGRVTPEQARQVFAEQIKALADCDVDLIVIETISDLYEMREAVLAARQVCDLPVLASITFTRDDRTLLGDHPKKAAEWLHAAGADLIPDAASLTRWTVLGDAQCRLAGTGRRTHYVSRRTGILWGLRGGLPPGRCRCDRGLLRHHTRAYQGHAHRPGNHPAGRTSRATSPA